MTPQKKMTGLDSVREARVRRDRGLKTRPGLGLADRVPTRNSEGAKSFLVLTLHVQRAHARPACTGRNARIGFRGPGRFRAGRAPFAGERLLPAQVRLAKLQSSRRGPLLSAAAERWETPLPLQQARAGWTLTAAPPGRRPAILVVPQRTPRQGGRRARGRTAGSRRRNYRGSRPGSLAAAP